MITFLWYEALFIALLPILIRTALTYYRKFREGSVTYFDGVFILTAMMTAFINWMIAGRLLLSTGTAGNVIAILEADAIGISLFVITIGYWINDTLNKYIHVPTTPKKTT